MASMINYLQKALRHHAPMIQFRYGLNQAGANSSTHTFNDNKNESKSAKNMDTSSSSAKPLRSIQKSVSFEFSETPKKYRRRPLTQDEIDLVTVGGLPS